MQLQLETLECDHSRPWYHPLPRNPVDQVRERIIADPSTRFSAWCRAQEIREARRAAERGRA